MKFDDWNMFWDLKLKFLLTAFFVLAWCVVFDQGCSVSIQCNQLKDFSTLNTDNGIFFPCVSMRYQIDNSISYLYVPGIGSVESVIYPVTFNFYFYCHFKSSLDVIVIIFVTITIFNKMITLHHFTKLHYTLVFVIRSLVPIYYYYYYSILNFFSFALSILHWNTFWIL